MAEDHPLRLLALASQHLEMTSARPLDAFPGSNREPLSMNTLLPTLLDVDIRETTGLLTALALLTTHRPHEDQIRAELRRRRWPLPTWLTGIDDFHLEPPHVMTDVLGDGENLFVGGRWPTGHALTALVYVDHNMGRIVKDAFVVPDAVDNVIANLPEPEIGTTLGPIDGVEARARIEQAISDGERTFPPFENDTWPAARPLVEWMIGFLPEGGTGYEWEEVPDEELHRIRDDVLASPEGAALADIPDAADILETLMWFATGYGPSDALRWSPVSVEILMTDWFPRKVMADAAYMRAMPPTLRAFIAYAHRIRDIPPSLTEMTLAAVDRWLPDYRRAAAGPRSGLGSMIDALMGSRTDDPFDGRSYEEYMLDRLAEDVGGHDALDALDDTPLPDEPFDWTDIADDIRPRVGEYLELIDACCDELLDVEYRTIMRRLLARAAVGDPAVFRRKARVDYGAAALAWIAVKVNDNFRSILAKDLAAWFGAPGSVSQRAETLRKAAGLPFDPYRTPSMGDVTLLHSNKRRNIIRSVNRMKELG